MTLESYCEWNHVGYNIITTCLNMWCANCFILKIKEKESQEETSQYKFVLVL